MILYCTEEDTSYHLHLPLPLLSKYPLTPHPSPFPPSRSDPSQNPLTENNMSTFMTGLGSMLGRKSQSPPSAKTSGPKVYSYSAGSQEAFDLSHHSALLQAFPNALPVSVFKSRVKHMLKSKGMDATTTLLSTPFCCDEVNRSFESAMASDFSGHSFNLGGLSGFPFAGTVGIGAMASHIPKDGSAFIIYGPHVGFANTHDVGKVERKVRKQITKKRRRMSAPDEHSNHYTACDDTIRASPNPTDAAVVPSPP